MPKGKVFFEKDKTCLRELVLKKKDIIECKRSDCINLKAKKEAWEQITADYNATAETSRTLDQLRRLWENIKAKRKSELAADKREIMKTGGGRQHILCTPDPELDALGLDAEIKDAIDSDTPIILEAEITPNNDIFILPTTSQNNNLQLEEKSYHQDNNFNYGLPITPNINVSKKRKRTDEFSAEAKMRVDRAQLLLDLDGNIGGLRRREMELNIILVEKNIILADEKIAYQRMKHSLKLNKFERETSGTQWSPGEE